MIAMMLAVTLGACGSDDGDEPMAAAALSGLGTATMTGTATFVQSGTDVTLELTLNGCASGKSYPVHIHQGASCADATAQGGHWDTARGEGIPNIACTAGTGSAEHTRAATPPEIAWSIGGDAATDVVGHVIVVHDADTPTTRIACGVIAP